MVFSLFENNNNNNNNNNKFLKPQSKCCVETTEVKVLWNIPLHLDVVPKRTVQTNLTWLYATRKKVSGSYLKELYVTSDKIKNKTN